VTVLGGFEYSINPELLNPPI